MKQYILIAFLLLSLLLNIGITIFWFVSINGDKCAIAAKENTELRRELNAIKKEEKYLFEVVLKSGADFQSYMPEYANVSKEDFLEAMRQKVVRLRIELEQNN